MVKKTWTKRMTAALVSVFLTVSMSLSAFAMGEPLDTGRTGSLTVTLAEQDTGKTVGGGGICLYKVADLTQDNGNYYYSMTETFAESGVSIMSTGQDEAAARLADYAAARELAGMTQVVGEDGTAAFANLELGIYLAVQTESADGWHPMSAFLVSIPMQIDGNGVWLYDLNANPKLEPSGGGNSSRPGENSGGSSSRGGGGGSSSSVTTTPQVVEIADEQIPLGTIVTDIVDGDVPLAPLVVTLPQTGQLNWPVPVMAVSGLVLFAIGWYLAFHGEKTHA